MLCLKYRTKDDLYLLHSKIFVKSEDGWLSTTISDPQLAYENFDNVKLIMRYDGYHGHWAERSIKINGEKFKFKDSSHHKLVTHLINLTTTRDEQLIKEMTTIVSEKVEKKEEEEEVEESSSSDEELSFESVGAYGPSHYQQQELYALVIKHAKIIAELDETSKVTQLAGKIVQLKNTVEDKLVTINTMEKRITKLEEQNVQLQTELKVVRDKNAALETEKINFRNNLLSQLRDVINKS